ncbi:hypothetical protein Pfo_021796 [Paulownia fortunei]|nr:hypothetical protein Pfo_021796 [Paulownia fortunei]
MSCGACCVVIVFAVSNKKLVVSFDAKPKDNPVHIDKLDVLSTHDRHLNQARTTFSSDDYDNSGYDFHYMDRELVQVSISQGKANKSTEIKNHHSTSTYTSEVEEDIKSLTAIRKDSSSVDLSGRSKHDKVLPNKTSTRHISRKESIATQIDLSSNEYSNTGTTFDSGEASREGDHLKVSRADESFFAGMIKKSFKDSNRSNETFEQEKANVTVHGHLIPYRLIKKAKKLVGPIHPGNYWYAFF